MLKFFKYILIQDIEIDKDHKVFQVLHALLRIGISVGLSFGLYHLLKDDIKSNIFMLILWIYFTLAFLASGPCAAIDMEKDITDPKPWIFKFGYYNSLGIFLAPICLMKYALKEK